MQLARFCPKYATPSRRHELLHDDNLVSRVMIVCLPQPSRGFRPSKGSRVRLRHILYSVELLRFLFLRRIHSLDSDPRASQVLVTWLAAAGMRIVQTTAPTPRDLTRYLSQVIATQRLHRSARSALMRPCFVVFSLPLLHHTKPSSVGWNSARYGRGREDGWSSRLEDGSYSGPRQKGWDDGEGGVAMLRVEVRIRVTS